MFNLLTFLAITTLSLCILYVLMTAAFAYGWLRTKVFVKDDKEETVSVTLIVPARNEEQNIAHCLDALLAQSYPARLLEIWVVDDSSEDNTAGIVKAYSEKHSHLKLFSLASANKKGKKEAIKEVISRTSSELIVTTDADCTMGTDWLANLVSFYRTSGAGMVVGPVAFANEKSLFEKLQSLELMALMGSTAGSLFFQKAILCNGANLAYKRELFHEVGGYDEQDRNLSGDDVLLMYRIAEKHPETIRFIKSREAIVYTSAKKSLGQFMAQRKRWASKGFAVLNQPTKAVALLVYGFSFFLLALGLLSAFTSIKYGIGLPFFRICLILTGIKCFIDFLLLFLAASFFDKRHYLLLFLPGQFIYIFYVVVVGMPGNRGKYEWKGRRSID